MKKVILAVFTALSFNGLQAQTMRADTAVMGPGYVNDVFYNVFSGTKATAINTDWHLAFLTKSRSSGIRINGGRGMHLYRVPNASISNFNGFDTTGWKQFPELFDSQKAWELDAFASTAAGPSSPFDMGWGDYDMISKHVVGDSLYIVELPGGIVKKLAIDTLYFDSLFVFRYANLDNSDMKTGRVSKNPFKRKLFTYFSLTTDQVMDKEPLDSTWHIKFTRYADRVPSGPGTFAYYPVVGALSNMGTEVVKANGVDVNAPFDPSFVFRRDISTIGSDWKAFDQQANQFVLKDSLVYFVRRNRPNTADSLAIAKIVFTGFGGGANGQIIMNTGWINTGINGLAESITGLGVYPNPAQSNATVVFNSNQNDAAGSISLYNIEGRQVFSNPLSVRNGLNQVNLGLRDLKAGLYIVKIETTGGQSTLRLIVNE